MTISHPTGALPLGIGLGIGLGTEDRHFKWLSDHNVFAYT